jgi:hypothetical protein
MPAAASFSLKSNKAASRVVFRLAASISSRQSGQADSIEESPGKTHRRAL